MRSHLPNPGQESSGPSEQKKSVFDRLGRQLETGRSMNRRSPYIDHLPPPLAPINEPEYSAGRYGRDQELEWRYQEERRHMQFARNQPPPPPPPQMGPHYGDLNMQGRQPQYYGPPGPGPYPPGPMGHQMSPAGLGGPMAMHQRRPSPKYDRHGNLIRGPPMRMEHGMSPPGNFMPHGPMMHPGFDMPPMRPGIGGMYPHPRWHEPLEMGMSQPSAPVGMMSNDQYMDPVRYQQPPIQSPQQQQPMINPELEGGPNKHSFGAPRYTKWRERRDVITNLDRETAQSSSRTDSLKSSLQQMDNKLRKESNKNLTKPGKQAASNPSTNNSIKKSKPTPSDGSEGKDATKSEPQEISDGEIVDDDDSSDESDDEKLIESIDMKTDLRHRTSLVRDRPESQLQYHEASKRRRLGDDYSMDYETISDDELDNFMSEKKASEDEKQLGDSHGKSSSEVELLNALGLDWANLVEMSKQSKKEATTSCSALRRFSLPNFLPTLGISSDLAGPEIYNLLLKICH